MIMKVIITTLIACLVMQQGTNIGKKSDRAHDRFIGPVKKVFEEWSPISGHRSDLPLGTRCRTHMRVYDFNGRLTQSSTFTNSCGSDETRNYYTYDKDGNRTSRTEEIRGMTGPPPPPPPMPPPGAIEDKGPPKTVFKYDSQGRKTEAATLRASGALIYKIVYKYDGSGRLQDFAQIGSDGAINSKIVYSYEVDKGFPAGYVDTDEHGRVTAKVSYSDYEFNAQGDWVKRKVITESSYNLKTASLEYRSIEYHQPTK